MRVRTMADAGALVCGNGWHPCRVRRDGRCQEVSSQSSQRHAGTSSIEPEGRVIVPLS